MNYFIGEEIPLDFRRFRLDDFDAICKFSCGNSSLDYYYHNELVDKKLNEIRDDDGVPFIFINKETEEIIGIVTLACYGIPIQIDNYMKIVPAIKIDTFALDKKYHKLPYDNDFQESDPYYLSDRLLSEIVGFCREISENMLAVSYIVLYSAKYAVKFYKRNLFIEFNSYMTKETNMEIKENIPLFLEL